MEVEAPSQMIVSATLVTLDFSLVSESLGRSFEVSELVY